MNLEKIKVFVNVMFWIISYRILGFLRETFIASRFGAGGESDSYFVAYSLPNLIVEVFAVGAMSSAIIPIFMQDIRNKEEVKKNISILLGNFLVIGLIFTALLILNMKNIIEILVPGFNEESKIITISLSRIAIIIIPALFFNEVLTSFLNCHNKTSNISFSNFLQNFNFLLFSTVLGKFLGIKGFIYSLTLAVFFKVVYNYIVLSRCVGFFTIKINFKNAKFKNVLKLLFPIMISSIGVQLNFIVDRIITSNLAEGSVSYLNYGNKIIQLPLGILLGTTILTTFPILIEHVQTNNILEIKKFIKNKIELILIIMVGITGFIFIFSKWIVIILFQRGNFAEKEVIELANVLKYYSTSIVGISFLTLFQKIFFSLKNTKLPSLINIISIFMNIVLNLILVNKFKVAGIAIATSISNIFNAFILFVFLKLKYNYLEVSCLRIVKILIFNVLIFIISYLIRDYFFNYNEYCLLKKYFIFLCITSFYLTLYLMLIIKIYYKKGEGF